MTSHTLQKARPKSKAPDGPAARSPTRRVQRHAAGPFGQPLQARLTVGQPGDRFEREADHAARSVLGAVPTAPTLSPIPAAFGGSLAQRACGACGLEKDKKLVQRKCACGGSGGDTCTCGCDDEHEKDMQNPGSFPVARKASSAAPAEPDGLDRVARTISKPGKPLPRGVRQDMEGRFDRSFRNVRMHDDRAAAASAAAVNAHAYTVGNHLVFGKGQFQPGSRAGKTLIAHELAHTVQQSGAAPAPPSQISRPSDPSEHQAHRAAASAMSPAPAAATAAAGLTPAPTQISRVGGSFGGAGASASIGGGSANVAEDGILDTITDTLGGPIARAMELAEELASAIGGAVSLRGTTVVISVPQFSPCPQFDFQGTLGDLGIVPSIDIPLLVGVLPVTGIVNLYGAFGIGAAINPGMGVRMDGCDLGPFMITIDPLRLSAGVAGAVAVDAALSFEAMADLSVFGEVGVMLIIPDPPAVIMIPVVGLRAGGTGQVRLTAGGSIRSLFSFSGSLLSGLSYSTLLSGDIGFQTDVGAGVFASLEVLGQTLCRFNFPLYEDHNDAQVSFDAGLNFDISRSGISASLAFRGGTPSYDPLAAIGADFDRSVLQDDCVLCDILSKIGAMPSDIAGPWPYHPTPELGGPIQVFPRNPGIAGGALCRGACGIDCPDQCTPARREIRCVNPEEEGGAHTLYVYDGYQECGTHQGCRDHDACYDWSAASGEVGALWFILGPRHRLCDLECACDYGLGNCIPWALGGGPQEDAPMAFATNFTIRKGCLGPCPGETKTEEGTRPEPLRLRDLQFFPRREFRPEPWQRRFGPRPLFEPIPIPITGTPVDAALLASARAAGGARVSIMGYIGPLRLTNSEMVLDPWGLVYGGSSRLSLDFGGQASVSISGALNGFLSLACLVELGSLTGELMVTGFLRMPSQLGAEASIRCHDGLLYLDAGVDFNTRLTASVMLSAQMSGRALGFDVFEFPWHSEERQLFSRRYELGIDFEPVFLGHPAEFVVDQRLIRIINMLVDLFGLSAPEEPDHEPNDEPEFIAEFGILDPCGWFGGGGDDDDDQPSGNCVEVKATAERSDAERILGSDDPRLTRPFWGPGTTLSNDCGSETVGTFMEAEYLTTKMTGGSRARGQDGIYRRGGFPTHAPKGSCFNSKPVPGTMFFIRGHLLNGNIGGPGNQNTNLFPITHNANGDHSRNVENGNLDVVGNVRSGKVMYYKVDVNHDSPERIVSDGIDQEFFRIDSSFRCEVAEYRVCEGDWLARKPTRTHMVLSTFIDQGGARSFNNIANPAGCPCKS